MLRASSFSAALVLSLGWASVDTTCGGNGGGMPCTFPFYFDERKYSVCTNSSTIDATDKLADTWCATETNEATPGRPVMVKWGYCTFCGPTAAPTHTPTQAPTSAPTDQPSTAPTSAPSSVPTVAPTHAPSVAPTVAPTQMPTQGPTAMPTTTPSHVPTHNPTSGPTTSMPTLAPSLLPTTSAPSGSPTHFPSTAPSAAPTSAGGIVLAKLERATADGTFEAALRAEGLAQLRVMGNMTMFLASTVDAGFETKLCRREANRNKSAGCVVKASWLIEGYSDARFNHYPGTKEMFVKVVARFADVPAWAVSSNDTVTSNFDPRTLTASPTARGPPPTAHPSISPTIPTSAPTSSPTAVPTPPTSAPTGAPTTAPTQVPTLAVGASAVPSAAPSVVPSAAPTSATAWPTVAPTKAPTLAPTHTTLRVTCQIVVFATLAPVTVPTLTPSAAPSRISNSSAPTHAPSPSPTGSPNGLGVALLLGNVDGSSEAMPVWALVVLIGGLVGGGLVAVAIVGAVCVSYFRLRRAQHIESVVLSDATREV